MTSVILSVSTRKIRIKKLTYNVKVFFRKKINLTSFFSSMVELFYIYYFVISTYYLPLIYIPRYILLFY